MNFYVIPAYYQTNRINQLGEAGKTWISSLPSIIQYLSDKWQLTVYPPFPNLSYNFVAPSLCADGTLAVLKICLPNDEFFNECNALETFNGEGAVKLLKSDPQNKAMLLEKVEPGLPLKTVQDETSAAQIAAEVIKTLTRKKQIAKSFNSILNYSEGFKHLREKYNGTTGPLPQELVERAETIFQKAAQSQNAFILLHGDLHHDNIRSSDRLSWLAIDPKGILGPQEYETGAFLRNNLPDNLDPATTQNIIQSRAEVLAKELDFDIFTIYQWAFAQSILSAWWIIEDNGNNFQEHIKLAAIVDELGSEPSHASAADT